MADLYDPNRNEPGTPRTAAARCCYPGAGHAALARRRSPRSGPPPAEPQPVPDAVPQGLPERVPTAGPDADRIRIGLWGAPRSGKTTYLAALPLAAMQHQRHHGGGWHISGMTEEANAYLSQGMDLLTRQRAFPEATMGVREIAWSVQGPRKKRKLGPGRRPNFVLDIQDAAGEVYGDGHPQQAQLVSLLARSHGLIYLFDPLGDAQRATESFNFLHSALTLLTAQVRNRGGLVDGRLPHHVSVCVAKFDHPGIFQPAAEAGWVTQDHEGAQLPASPRSAARSSSSGCATTSGAPPPAWSGTPSRPTSTPGASRTTRPPPSASGSPRSTSSTTGTTSRRSRPTGGSTCGPRRARSTSWNP
ncbi:hypothetical protein NQP46_02360 [Streptomyces albus]|nr:hypothetical protein NQP46_02360 [Streptomyces albus]